MKTREQKMKSENGVTIVALAITIIVLLILASISIAVIRGNDGIVERATDSQIETELSQLQEKLNRYKLQGEAERRGNGDYSGQMTNNDLVKMGILKRVHINNPDMTIGIVDLEKLGEKSNLGNNYKNINTDEIENFSDLYDVFIIDFATNDVYYVKNDDYWIREGETGSEKDNSSLTEGGPTISVSPSEYEGEETIDITISVEKGNAELSNSNDYEFYLSSSNDDLEKGNWIIYTPGKALTIGEGLDGEYYLYVKQVKDENEKFSAGGKTVIIKGKKYHRFGKYIFNNNNVENYSI